LLAGPIEISQRAAIHYAHDTFLKAQRDVEWNFENHFPRVIDKAAAIAILNCCQAFAKTLSVGELHRHREVPGLIDIAPFAWFIDHPDMRNCRLSDIDRGQAFGKTIDDVKLCFKDDASTGIDKKFLATAHHQRQTFSE